MKNNFENQLQIIFLNKSEQKSLGIKCTHKVINTPNKTMSEFEEQRHKKNIQKSNP